MLRVPNRNAPLEDFVKLARAPIEHLFNNHEWCDPEWCWSKSLSEKQEKMMAHVRESHKQNLLVCTPCDDDLVAGATVINGGATTIDNDLVAGATVVNGDATTIDNDLVAGATVVNGDATTDNDLVSGDATITSATVVNGDATSSGSDYFSSDGYSSNTTDN